MHRHADFRCLVGRNERPDTRARSRQKCAVSAGPVGSARDLAEARDELFPVVLVKPVMEREREEVVVAAEDTCRQHRRTTDIEDGIAPGIHLRQTRTRLLRRKVTGRHRHYDLEVPGNHFHIGDFCLVTGSDRKSADERGGYVVGVPLQADGVLQDLASIKVCVHHQLKTREESDDGARAGSQSARQGDARLHFDVHGWKVGGFRPFEVVHHFAYKHRTLFVENIRPHTIKVDIPLLAGGQRCHGVDAAHLERQTKGIESRPQISCTRRDTDHYLVDHVFSPRHTISVSRG